MLVISDDRGVIWHLNGTGRLHKWISPFVVQFLPRGQGTYTTRPSSTQSVLEGKIGLPSASRSSSMLAAHSMDAMSMSKALFATCIPRQIRRPKPWRNVDYFWIKNICMLTICYVSLSMSILMDDMISLLIEESLRPEFFVIGIDIGIPKQWMKSINFCAW